MKEKSAVTIGLIQTAVSEDLKANLEKTIGKVKEAAKKGAQIVCLQELYRSRYFPQDDKKDASRFAEAIPGESTKAFSAIAKDNSIVIIVPLFEKGKDGSYYNSAVVIDADGKLLETYRKIHIPHDPLFYEKSYFTQGNEYRVYKTKYATFAVLICYDQWYPEAARICTLKGADILFYPTAIGNIKDYSPPEGDWHEAWETIQRSHAIANCVHVAAVNRIGEEGELQFWGGSFACDSFGNVLARAGKDKEEVLVVKLDLSKNEPIREGWGFLRNRRPDTYAPLTKKGSDAK